MIWDKERKWTMYTALLLQSSLNKFWWKSHCLPQWLLIKVICKFGTISQILLHLRVMPVEGVLYYYNIGVVVNRHHHCFMIKVAATTYLFIILFSMTTHHKQCWIVMALVWNPKWKTWKWMHHFLNGIRRPVFKSQSTPWECIF